MTQPANGTNGGNNGGAPQASSLTLTGGAAVVAPVNMFPNGIPANALVVMPLSKPTDELLGMLEKGAVAVTQSFAPTRGAAGRSLVLQGLFALFAMILLVGVVLIVVRGFLLRPLRAISARFAAIGTGETVEEDEDDDKLSDEMAELAAEQKRIAALVAAKKGRGA